MRAKGNSKNRERGEKPTRKSQQRKEGPGTAQDGLSTFSQEQSSLENQLQDNDLSA